MRGLRRDDLGPKIYHNQTSWLPDCSPSEREREKEELVSKIDVWEIWSGERIRSRKGKEQENKRNTFLVHLIRNPIPNSKIYQRQQQQQKDKTQQRSKSNLHSLRSQNSSKEPLGILLFPPVDALDASSGHGWR